MDWNYMQFLIEIHEMAKLQHKINFQIWKCDKCCSNNPWRYQSSRQNYGIIGKFPIQKQTNLFLKIKKWLMLKVDANSYIRYTQKYRKIFGTKFLLCDFFADIGITNPFLKIIRGIYEKSKIYKIFHECPYKTVRFSDIFFQLNFYWSNSRVRF